MNLLLLENHDVDEAGLACLDGARAAHVINVLKAVPGQTLRIGLLDGPHGEGEVVRAADGTVALRCRFATAIPDRPAVELLLALPRPKVMRRLWAQVAALGVARITLLKAWKVERMYFDSHVLSPASYRPLLIEGLQQARDTRVPEVRFFRRFADWIDASAKKPAPSCEARWLADTGVDGALGSNAPKDVFLPARRVQVAIGPEGGWTDRERASWLDLGFKAVSLGSRALRSDTACIALLALAHQAVRQDGGIGV